MLTTLERWHLSTSYVFKLFFAVNSSLNHNPNVVVHCIKIVLLGQFTFDIATTTDNFFVTDADSYYVMRENEIYII